MDDDQLGAARGILHFFAIMAAVYVAIAVWAWL